MKKIILASKSPRRKDLLNLIGINYEIHPGNWKEEEQRDIHLSPRELCCYNALQKAGSVTIEPCEDCIIIGCDTIVVMGDKILEKPHKKEKAKEMLFLLSGKTHYVYSGLCLRDNISGKEITELVETSVTFRKLSSYDIESYVATGEPLDKAGAYGIQGKGSLLVERIEGCYYNVVGLPLTTLYRLLNRMDVDVWSY